MFNHQARWDKRLPQTPIQKAGTETKIQVVCTFDEKGRIAPESFIWKGDRLHIHKVNFFWQNKEEGEVLRFFSVATEAGTYELAFRTQSLSWHLRRLISP